MYLYRLPFYYLTFVYNLYLYLNSSYIYDICLATVATMVESISNIEKVYITPEKPASVEPWLAQNVGHHYNKFLKLIQVLSSPWVGETPSFFSPAVQHAGL